MLLVPVVGWLYSVPPSMAYKSRHHLTSSSATQNHTNCDLGAAAADRVIIAGITVYDSGGAPSITSVTIGGVAATVLDYTNPDGAEMAAAWAYAVVPSGATGTIAVVTSGGISESDVAWWAAYGVAAAPKSHLVDSSFTGDALSGSLTIPATGFGFGYSILDSSSGTVSATWTNLTERYDGAPLSNSREVITFADYSTAGAATRTMTASGSCDRGCLLLAAWGP